MSEYSESENAPSAAVQISFCQPDDPWILKKIIILLEIIFGSKHLFAI